MFIDPLIHFSYFKPCNAKCNLTLSNSCIRIKKFILLFSLISIDGWGLGDVGLGLDGRVRQLHDHADLGRGLHDEHHLQVEHVFDSSMQS